MRLLRQFIYLFIFIKIFRIKESTQTLFKYLNTPKKHNKALKQLSFRHYAQKHNKVHKQLSFRYYAQKHKKKQTTFRLNIFIRLKKHTSNFHLDITPRSIKKQTTFRLNIFIRLKKHTSNFHSDITPRSIKNKQLFVQRQLVQDVMNNFSLRYMLKKKIVGTRCNE